MISVTKYPPSPGARRIDRNIRRLEPIDNAAWLWHPDVPAGTPAFLRLACPFTTEACTLRIHLTADQHYVLFVDGNRIARGPDRGDVQHWSYATYDLELAAGEHQMEVAVWWLGEHGPMSMMTHRGGFALWADAPFSEQLSTGLAPWKVCRREGWTLRPHHFDCYHVIGDSLFIDAAAWHAAECSWVEPEVVRPPVRENEHGVDEMGGWKCFPSALPALMDRHKTRGRIRTVVENYEEGATFSEAPPQDMRVAAWQDLLDNTAPVTVPPHQRLAVLWDFEDYQCGFHEICLRGGRGARLECSWAESLFLPDRKQKGHRGEIEGKVFHGFGNGYRADGEARCWLPYWVCSGRYILLEIYTGAEPLVVEQLSINEVRYPLELECRIDTGNQDLESILPLCIRALESCAHDHMVDCPYYEQLMYMGDTRIELLTLYTLTRDPRLAERCITLFDYSRRVFGFAAERYPAREDQLSTTFAAIWVLSVRDYALWRDNPDWVRERMRGVRANLDHFLPYRNAAGFVEDLPGWSFIDWVPDWHEGYGPGHADGCCGPSNLFYLLALQAAMELETMLGSPHLAAYYRELAEQTAEAIRATFWDEARGAFADDRSHRFYSQHSQSLAIIAGLVPVVEEAERLARFMLGTDDIAQCTIYFQYYLFEALGLCGAGNEILDRYAAWMKFKENGFYTTPETPEPTRSDCHAWGAHAYHHLVASLAGVRPAGASFREVRIAPASVNLPRLKMRIPHPQGFIELDLKRTHGTWHGTVVLPEGCMGQFIDGEYQQPCSSGETRVPRQRPANR